jgi:hypothetical protein
MDALRSAKIIAAMREMALREPEAHIILPEGSRQAHQAVYKGVCRFSMGGRIDAARSTGAVRGIGAPTSTDSARYTICRRAPRGRVD